MKVMQRIIGSILCACAILAAQSASGAAKGSLTLKSGLKMEGLIGWMNRDKQYSVVTKDPETKKNVTLQDKIDAAQKKQAKVRAETVLDPVTVNPAASMTTPYTVVGMLLRALVLFLGIFGPGLRIAVRCPDDRGRLVVIGILTLIFCHLYVNVAMSVGLVPITGLPLPFISAGRTFLIVLMAALGIVQSVAVHHAEPAGDDRDEEQPT
jgi:hypothetical protein